MNPQEIVNQIRARAIREAARPRTAAPDAALESLREQIIRLRIAYEELHGLRNSVGRMPPSPKTGRARFGAALVRVVQRLLFWYTPQIHRIQNANTAVAENACLVAEEQLAVLEKSSADLGRMCTEVRLRTGAVERTAADIPLPIPCSGFEAFAFALERDLQARTANHSQEYLDMIESAEPPVPAGVWLDVACGDGKWLSCVQADGRTCAGIDGNPAAVAHCKEQGLPVQRADALEYLRGCPDGQFAVIALLRVAGCNAMPRLFALVQEAVRTLMPGGAILFESPNPANALAACNEFWTDANYMRPLPLAAASYLLEYFGLRVMAQRMLDACSEDEMLPLNELNFVRQINGVLYGPRSYALLARSDASVRQAADPKVRA